MVDLLELMEIFNLDEKPYCNLGCEWCVTRDSIYFVEDGMMYSSIKGELIGKEEGMVCINNDLQQFLGMQPAVFTSVLKITPEEFEEKYKDLM